MRTSCFCQTNVWIEHFEVRMRSWCNFTSIINRQNLKYNAGCSQKSEGGKKNMTKQNSFFLVVHFQTCPVSCWFSVPHSKSEAVWLKLTTEKVLLPHYTSSSPHPLVQGQTEKQSFITQQRQTSRNGNCNFQAFVFMYTLKSTILLDSSECNDFLKSFPLQEWQFTLSHQLR